MAVAAALSLLVIVVMAVAAALSFSVIMVVIVTAAALSVVIMMMVMAVLMGVLSGLLHELFHHIVLLLDNFQKLCSSKLADRCSHNRRILIVLADHLHSSLYLFRICYVSSAEYNGSGIFNLVVEKLAEILHIHAHLAGISHSDSTV